MDEKLFRHGSFSWFELMTSDAEGAKSFYEKLFGWSTQSMEMENPMTYNVVEVAGDQVGGIMEIPPQSGQMPPMWGIYITVDDVDAAAAAADKMGGQVPIKAGPDPIASRYIPSFR